MATEDMWEEIRIEKQKRWLYLGKAFFVDMIHHDNFIVKRSTGPPGAGQGKKKKKSENIPLNYLNQTVALTSKTMKEHESEGRDACINLSHETNCRLKLIYSSSKCRLRANTIQLFIGTIPDYICRFSYTSASLKNRPYTLQINVLSSQLLKIATRGAPSHTANNGINMWHAVHYFWGGTTAEAVTQQWFHFRAIATVDPRGNFSKGNQTCFTHPQELS